MTTSERLRALREAKPEPRPKPAKHVTAKTERSKPGTGTAIECPHCGKPIDMGQAMRAAGKKGGAVKKPKGFATMDPKRRSEIAREAALRMHEERRKKES